MSIPFNKLNDHLRNKLLAIRAAGSSLKGMDGEKEAEQFFRRKRAKSSRKWRNVVYYQMIRVDHARKKIGLPPVYFE